MPSESHLMAPSTPFLYIPISRLILLSIFTFHFYEFYWIYKNWDYIKKRYQLDIQPFWRAFFSILFIHDLFKRIHDDSKIKGHTPQRFPAIILAAGWFFLAVIANAFMKLDHVQLALLSCLIPSYLFLVPAQYSINTAIKNSTPQEPYYKWSTGHLIWMAVGVFYWIVFLRRLFLSSII